MNRRERNEACPVSTTAEDFHPELKRLARVLPPAIVSRRTFPVMRRLTALAQPGLPRGVGVQRLPSGLRVRLHRPERALREGAALLWIHGGGYVMGSAAQDDRLCRRFARELGVPVASADYRLAPEHPYPAALEDCYETLTWLARQPGVDPERIAIAGASAGGGLAAALALLARDRGEIAPVFQLLVYPMVQAPAGQPQAESPGFRLWNHAANRLGWQKYLSGADPAQVAPLRRPDLSGVAPAWIGVGTLDPLHDEDVAYADRLAEAAVPCELETVAGAFHGFDRIAPRAGVSVSFARRQREALSHAFARA